MKFGDPCASLLERPRVVDGFIGRGKSFMSGCLRRKDILDTFRRFTVACQQSGPLLILRAVDDKHPVYEGGEAGFDEQGYDEHLIRTAGLLR